MKIHTIVIDNFLNNPDQLREHCLGLSFEGVHNPEDDIFYKDVDLNVPDKFRIEIVRKIEFLLGDQITKAIQFLRLRPKDSAYAPHEVHSDKIMGHYTALIYLNPNEQCEGGTAFVEHTSGNLSGHPETEEQIALWEKDNSELDKWNLVGFVPMVYNRLVIFRSDLLHYAEPIGGFGNTKNNSRLVFTMFFNVASLQK